MCKLGKHTTLTLIWAFLLERVMAQKSSDLKPILGSVIPCGIILIIVIIIFIIWYYRRKKELQKKKAAQDKELMLGLRQQYARTSNRSVISSISTHLPTLLVNGQPSTTETTNAKLNQAKWVWGATKKGSQLPRPTPALPGQVRPTSGVAKKAKRKSQRRSESFNHRKPTLYEKNIRSSDLFEDQVVSLDLQSEGSSEDPFELNYDVVNFDTRPPDNDAGRQAFSVTELSDVSAGRIVETSPMADPGERSTDLSMPGLHVGEEDSVRRDFSSQVTANEIVAATNYQKAGPGVSGITNPVVGVKPAPPSPVILRNPSTAIDHHQEPQLSPKKPKERPRSTKSNKSEKSAKHSKLKKSNKGKVAEKTTVVSTDFSGRSSELDSQSKAEIDPIYADVRKTHPPEVPTKMYIEPSPSVLKKADKSYNGADKSDGDSLGIPDISIFEQTTAGKANDHGPQADIINDEPSSPFTREAEEKVTALFDSIFRDHSDRQHSDSEDEREMPSNGNESDRAKPRTQGDVDPNRQHTDGPEPTTNTHGETRLKDNTDSHYDRNWNRLSTETDPTPDYD